MNCRKRWICCLAAVLMIGMMLSGCTDGKKAVGPKPQKGRAGSEAYEEIFAPLLENISWGMQVHELPSDYPVVNDEAIRGDGILTIPLYIYVKVYDRDMTVWLKFDEGDNAGLYEMTLRFDPEFYVEIRDRMIRDFGAYQTDEGDPEKSVFFQSRPISDYYTKEEIRQIYLKIMDEEELSEEELDFAMGNSEFVFSVRSGGTISMSARNHMAIKKSWEE